MQLASSPSPKFTTKTQEVHQQLVAMAMALGPSAKMPTVSQLRRDFGVSITTLDNALQQLESKNIIFRKQGSGIFVSPRLHQRCVGLVCDPAFFSLGISPFWRQLIVGAQSRASEGGEAFRFYVAMGSADGRNPVPDDLIEDVAARRIQGILFLGNNETAQKWFKQRSIPSVVFAGRGDYRVEIDVDQLIYLGGQRLLDRGCERLALLCPWESQVDPPAAAFEWNDVKAFRSFLNEAGLPVVPELIWDARSLGNRVTSVPETHQEQGYQAIMNLFDGSKPAPDGLLSTDDMMTRGVIMGLRKLGLQPGHDIRIVSHVNRGSTVLNGEDENIEFIEINPAEIIDKMFGQLEILMSKETPPQACLLVEARNKKQS